MVDETTPNTRSITHGPRYLFSPRLGLRDHAFGLSIRKDELERLFAFTGVRKTVTTRQIVTVSKGKSVTVGGRQNNR